MQVEGVKTQDSRINIRVDGELKREADKGIPFPLTISRAQEIGEEAAEMETAFGKAVAAAIARKHAAGLPVARFDADTERPYLEYPDGH